MNIALGADVLCGIWEYLLHRVVLRVAADFCPSQQRGATTTPRTGLPERSVGAHSDDRLIREHKKRHLLALYEAL
jgi:hypothetical protein